MYESFFGFQERPFDAAPRTDRYYPGEVVELAREALTRCIDRAAGCGLLVGPPGSGKTLLCHVLAEHFSDRLAPVLLSSVRLGTRKDLLQAILFELGQPYRRMEEGELRLALIDRMSPGEGRGEGMLLIVDEAHSVSPALFDELRLLTNLVREGRPRVRLVMAGSAVLEERFASPKLASLNQRLVARCYLESLRSEETAQYVLAQTAAAGGQHESIWSQEALRAVHQATDGCPRLVNQLCDHALLLAARQENKTVEARCVQEAWADLQQLPTPWSDPPAPQAGQPSHGDAPQHATVIEFGSLDDDEPTSDSLASSAELTLDPTDTTGQIDRDPQVTDIEVDFEQPSTERQLDTPDDLEYQAPLERIETHLSAVEQALQDEQALDRQVELVFDEACDDADLSDAPTDGDEELDEQEVVLVDQFAGLEAGNVVQLSPNVLAYREDDEDDCGEDPGGSDNESEVMDVVHPEPSESRAPLPQMGPREPTYSATDPAPVPAARGAEGRQPAVDIDPAPATEHRTIPVGGREYRQLFATLRNRSCDRGNSSDE